MKTNLLFIAALVLLTTSCTITKRNHLRGYHVQWHNADVAFSKQEKKKTKPVLTSEEKEDIVISHESKPITESPQTLFELFDSSTQQLEGNRNTHESKGTATNQLVTAPNSSPNSATDEKVKATAPELANFKRIPSEKTKVKHKKRLNTEPEPQEERKFEGLAIAGFVIAIVGWIVPVPLAFILLLIGIIFGAIGMTRVLNEPTKRKGMGLAVASLVLGILGTVILIAAA